MFIANPIPTVSIISSHFTYSFLHFFISQANDKHITFFSIKKFLNQMFFLHFRPHPSYYTFYLPSPFPWGSFRDSYQLFAPQLWSSGKDIDDVIGVSWNDCGSEMGCVSSSADGDLDRHWFEKDCFDNIIWRDSVQFELIWGGIVSFIFWKEIKRKLGNQIKKKIKLNFFLLWFFMLL